MGCFCIRMGEFALFVWFGVVRIGFLLEFFVFVVKIVVTSLWVKPKVYLVSLFWLVVIFF